MAAIANASKVMFNFCALLPTTKKFLITSVKPAGGFLFT